MRLTEAFAKTRREAPHDEVSTNAQLLIRAGLVEKVAAGVYAQLPLGLRVIKNIEQVVREEMDRVGGQEIYLSVLHPKEYWQRTGRWDGLDILFKVKSQHGSEYAMGPTHEEALVPIAKQFIQSYKDLPKRVYQIQVKFRDEPRAKSGLLRGREFLMKDFYSFHADPDDLEETYEQLAKAYQRVFERFGLTAIRTEASGGSFSPLSHEFQVATEAGEDIIFHCGCGFARNREIIEPAELGELKPGETAPCPQCGQVKTLEVLRAIEVGNIFKLGTKFSDPFELTFLDHDGQRQPVLMGCYGIGITRLMGAIVEVHHDERGIVWPQSIAPALVQLVEVRSKNQDPPAGRAGVRSKAERLYSDLTKAGIEVVYDDREDLSAGQKFADADLLGLPIRLVVSERTLEQESVEWKQRAGGKIEMVKMEQVIERLKQ